MAADGPDGCPERICRASSNTCGDELGECRRVLTMKADRLVLLSYVRDGKPRRGTGLCIGEHFILTADHCADGVDHQAVVDGQAYPAAVLLRTHQKQIDLAVLSAADLPSKSQRPCARINSVDLETVHGCRVAGYSALKVVDAAVPTVAQVDGHVPTSEGADPFAQSGSPRRMILKVTTDSARDILVLSGSIDQPKSLVGGNVGRRYLLSRRRPCSRCCLRSCQTVGDRRLGLHSAWRNRQAALRGR
jgi:Trypsin-like peptidase domain